MASANFVLGGVTAVAQVSASGFTFLMSLWIISEMLQGIFSLLHVLNNPLHRCIGILWTVKINCTVNKCPNWGFIVSLIFFKYNNKETTLGWVFIADYLASRVWKQINVNQPWSLISMKPHKCEIFGAWVDKFTVSLRRKIKLVKRLAEVPHAVLKGHGFDCRKTTNKKHTSGSS